MTVRLRHKNGSWRHVEGSGQNLLHVPAIRGITCNARDITERVRASEFMEFQAKLLQTVEQAVIATDLAGRVTYWNRHAERLYGWMAMEVIGREARDYLVGPNLLAEADAIVQMVHTGQSWSGEMELTRKDGSSFTASITNTPISDPAGAIIGVVGVSSDVTARRTLELQLRQAQKVEAVGMLAGGIAHDFNNILTAITGFSELLMESASEEQREDLREIHAAARCGSDLTRQLLAFSRKQVVRVETLDVNEVLRGMEKMLRRMIRENITLETSYTETPVFIDADRSQLEQVVLNLVVNARDAMGEGGRVSLSTRIADDTTSPPRVSICVTDTGTGMSDDVRRRIFEPFFTTKPEGKGTGLGLSVVFGIVDQLKGRIDVQSAPGLGSTFSVHLPLSSRSANATSREDESVVSGSETILLVEDNEGLAAVTARVLHGLGYAVVRAPNGSAAKSLLARRPAVDLVLTDVVMPEMSGPELVQWMADDGIAVPVLYTSGYTQGAELSDAVSRGEASFIPKPWTPRDLARAVRHTIDRRHAPAA
jgi:PAS domain S-box-containing protein